MFKDTASELSPLVLDFATQSVHSMVRVQPRCIPVVVFYAMIKAFRK